MPPFPSSGADSSKRSGIKRCWESRKDKGPPEQTQPAGLRPPHRRSAKRRSSRSKRKLNSRPRNPDVPVTTLDAVPCSDTNSSVVLLGRVFPVSSKSAPVFDIKLSRSHIPCQWPSTRRIIAYFSIRIPLLAPDPYYDLCKPIQPYCRCSKIPPCFDWFTEGYPYTPTLKSAVLGVPVLLP